MDWNKYLTITVPGITGHTERLTIFFLVALTSVLDVACSASPDSASEPSPVEDACASWCEIDCGCDDEYPYPISRCISGCVRGIRYTDYFTPNCTALELEYLNCVGNLTCEEAWGDIYLYSDSTSECEAQLDAELACMDAYRGSEAEQLEQIEEQVEQACLDYPEETRCGEYTEDMGDTPTLHVASSEDLAQWEHCRCFRMSVIFPLQYIQEIELPELEEVAGDLVFIGEYDFELPMNEKWTHISMPSLHTVDGELSIFGNRGPMEISFPELRKIGALELRVTEEMTDLEWLSTLEEIDSDMHISQNDSLTNLDGLANLKSVNGPIRISYNDVLTDISALANVSFGYGEDFWPIWTGLEIIENSMLPTCDAMAFKKNVAPESMPVCIENNLADKCAGDTSGC